MDESHVLAEIEILVKVMKENGIAQDDGSYDIKFGDLYDKTTDVLEAINGTIRAAKKRKIVDFKGQMLLKGPNDSVIVKLLVQE